MALVNSADVFCAITLAPRLKLSVTSNEADKVASIDWNLDLTAP